MSNAFLGGRCSFVSCVSRQCSGGGWRSRHYYTRPVPALTSHQPQHEFGQRLQSQVSELQADGGQGEGDEKAGGETGQVRHGGGGGRGGGGGGVERHC